MFLPLIAASLLLLSAPPLPAQSGPPCSGDCDDDGAVTVSELIKGVGAALDPARVAECRAVDGNGDGRVTISELIRAVKNALDGCAVTLDAKLRTLAWFAYAPTSFTPDLGCPNGFPSQSDMRADLEVAYAHGFRGIITFGANCTLDEVPRIARQVGFDGVIMGLFLFADAQRREELDSAKAAAPHVDGYGIGNEGLIGCGGNLYTSDTLVDALAEVRAATGKPVTTSEQIEDYLSNGGCLGGFLLSHGDWLFPIIHPFNHGFRDPGAGAAFTEDRFGTLSRLTTKTVFFKETGWPTGGDAAATEENQETYFLALREGPARFAYFEGFDQPWKVTLPLAWEPHFGLFRHDRSPKRFIAGNRRDARR